MTEPEITGSDLLRLLFTTLLQQIESYGGPVLLLTNSVDNIDAAFLRRLDVVVHFPLPDAVEREGI